MGDVRGMAEVTLVEADGSPAAPPPPAGPRAGWARLRPARRWWWTAIAGLLIVAVAASVAAQWRERERLAGLARIPGVVAPIVGPLASLWSTDVDLWGGRSAFAGQFVSVQERADGSVDASAVDSLTGRQRWRTQVRAPGVVPDSGAASDVPDDPTRPGLGIGPFTGACANPGNARPTDDADAARSLACVVVDAIETTTTGTSGSVQPTKTRLVVIDAATGTLVSDDPTPPSTAVATLGTDLVIASVDADGLHVRRTDATATTTRWTFSTAHTSSSIAPANLQSWLSISGDLIAVSVRDQVHGGTSSNWLLDSDGKRIDLPAGSGAELAARGTRLAIDVTAAGRRVLEQFYSDAGVFSTTITDVTTSRSVTTKDYPTVLAVDDGSLPDLVLTEPFDGGMLIGMDLTTGRQAWSVRTGQDSSGAGSALILDGRVLVTGTNTLMCLDGATGTLVWSVPVIGAAQGPVLTDGRIALLVRQNDEADPEIAAYDLSDGRYRWSTPLEETLRLTVMDGTLYGAVSTFRDPSAVGLTAFGTAPDQGSAG